MLWQVLTQFVFRLSFGVALAMAITPPRLVTSGFFRVHLWVLLGLNTFVCLGAATRSDLFPHPQGVLSAAVAGGITSYLGSIIWLYEKANAGRVALAIVAICGVVGSICSSLLSTSVEIPWNIGMAMADLLTGGLLLGATLSAMLLGHWYLNTPTMQLLPLRRLILLISFAVFARAVTCGLGLMGLEQLSISVSSQLLALRWLAGILGIALLAWMTWQTLKIPNTQSATGILYVAVICVFLGELTSQLLSADAPYPL